MVGKIKPKVVVICGATASGKTQLALEIANDFDCEIISADSRQVFKYMDIGTAKASIDEQKIVKHHFIDTHFPDEYFSAGQFGKQAKVIAESIYNSGKLPLIVGGTGLYIKAFNEGLFDDEDGNSNNDLKQNLINEYNQKSKEELFVELKAIDPDAATMYPDKNPRRLIRALVYYKMNGVKFSQAIGNSKDEEYFDTLYLGINHQREDLYKVINSRTEQMWELGIVEETQKILAMGYSPTLNSMNTVGYKEVLDYLDGKLSKKEAISIHSMNTRRYSKRQLTWFRGQLKDKFCEMRFDTDAILRKVSNYLKND